MDQSAPYGSSSSNTLPEETVMAGFHVFTVNSLAQAKLEGLLDDDSLASAEGDVMVCGPALCLYFAALRSNTIPPSVPMPGSSRSSAPQVLNTQTCPPIFQAFFRLWSTTVPTIQSLPSSQQHDLARIICDKAPLTPSSNVPATLQTLNRVAADLRSVAIEITQRRTFQERYRADLQSALDVGQSGNTPGEKRRVAAFSPPPSYDESSNGSHSQHSSVHSSPARVPMTLDPTLPGTPIVAGTEAGMPSIERKIEPIHSRPGTHLTVMNPDAGPSTSRSRPISPTILPPDAPAINFIRETLYAALAEVISMHPRIKTLLITDPPRAYFASVALSILTVSSDCLTPDGGVITPVGHVLTLEECPKPYQPLMIELAGIGKEVKRMTQEDDERAILAVRDGDGTEIGEPRMERLKRMLEYGVAMEEERYDTVAPAPAPSPVLATSPSGRNRYNSPTSPPPGRTRAPIPIPDQQSAARASLENARRSLEQGLHEQQQSPRQNLEQQFSPNHSAGNSGLPPPPPIGSPRSPASSSHNGRPSGQMAYHSDNQARASHESPSAEPFIPGPTSSPTKTQGKEVESRSSSEERSGKGGHRVLRKSKPPPVAPKPLPPKERPVQQEEGASVVGSTPGKISKQHAPSDSGHGAGASPTNQSVSADPLVTPPAHLVETSTGYAGVGAGARPNSSPQRRPVPLPAPHTNANANLPYLHPQADFTSIRGPNYPTSPRRNQGSSSSRPNLINTSTPTPSSSYQLVDMPGRGRTPPRAAMLAHQESVHVTGSPYEHALGSGLRIPGEEYSVNQRQGQRHGHGSTPGQGNATTAVAATNTPIGNDHHSPSPSRSSADLNSSTYNLSSAAPANPTPSIASGTSGVASSVASTANGHPPISATGGNSAIPPLEIVPSTRPSSPEQRAPRRSMEGTTVQFANKINSLAIKLTTLRMFQERQDMVFKILASVTD